MRAPDQLLVVVYALGCVCQDMPKDKGKSKGSFENSKGCVVARTMCMQFKVAC